jgi:hypothetical protein
MDVFAVHIRAAIGQRLTRWSETAWNTYDFSVFQRAGQESIRCRALRHRYLDPRTINFIGST